MEIFERCVTNENSIETLGSLPLREDFTKRTRLVELILFLCTVIGEASRKWSQLMLTLSTAAEIHIGLSYWNAASPELNGHIKLKLCWCVDCQRSGGFSFQRPIQTWKAARQPYLRDLRTVQQA